MDAGCRCRSLLEVHRLMQVWGCVGCVGVVLPARTPSDHSMAVRPPPSGGYRPPPHLLKPLHPGALSEVPVNIRCPHLQAKLIHRPRLTHLVVHRVARPPHSCPSSSGSMTPSSAPQVTLLYVDFLFSKCLLIEHLLGLLRMYL